MRELLFRAWWKDGSGLVDQSDYVIRPNGTIEFPEGGWDLWESDDSDLVVLEQFTGVVDKNGNKIFENDILCANTGDKWESGVHSKYLQYAQVVYNSQKARFEIFGKLGESHKALDQVINKYHATVVGNIYNNPDLMKEIIK